MRLAAALLANGAEQRDGLIFMIGGGWDTAWIPPGQEPTFRGAVVVRVLATQAECGRDHNLEITLEAQDGDRVLGIGATVRPDVPPDYPADWDVPFNFVFQFRAPLPRLGNYRISVLVDRSALGSIPIRAVEGLGPGAGIAVVEPNPT